MRHDAPSTSRYVGNRRHPVTISLECRGFLPKSESRTFLDVSSSQLSTRKADVLAAQAPLGHLYRMCADKNGAMTGAASLSSQLVHAFPIIFPIVFPYFMNESWMNHDPLISIDIHWIKCPSPSKRFSQGHGNQLRALPAQVSPCRFCRPKPRWCHGDIEKTVASVLAKHCVLICFNESYDGISDLNIMW